MKRRRGFTLIELVLSMAIAAGLAAALYRSMATVWRAKKVAAAAIEPSRAGGIAMEIISRDLASVPPCASSTSNTITLRGPFQASHTMGAAGDNDNLYFRTIGRDEQADVNDPFSEGMRAVEYFVRTDGSEPVLVRRVTRNLLAATQEPEQEEVLCRNVRTFSVRCFDGYTWQESWESTQLGDVIPFAVGITIEVIVPQANPGQPVTRRMTRVLPLACAKPIPTG